MTKTEIYNSDYTALNHSYIQIYDMYTKLLEADDKDEEVMNVLAGILVVLNPTLDKIKSEMTVATRFVDGSGSSGKPAATETVTKEVTENGGVIFHPNFN